MGTQSNYDTPTHTTTITSIAPIATIGFTSEPTITVTADYLMTFNKTDTSIIYVTKTVTEKLTGSIFSTTMTRYSWHAHHENYTQTVERGYEYYNTTTVNVYVPYPTGFKAINGTLDPAPAETGTNFVPTAVEVEQTSESTSQVTTVPCTESSCSSTFGASATNTISFPWSSSDSLTSSLTGSDSVFATGTASADSSSSSSSSAREKMVVYVYKDGRMIPTPIEEIAQMVGGIDGGTRIEAAAAVANGQAQDKLLAITASPALNEATTTSSNSLSIGTFTAQTSESSIETSTSTSSSSSSTEERKAETTIGDTPRFTHEKRYAPLQKRDAQPEEQSSSTTSKFWKPTLVKGLQGALSSTNPAHSGAAFAQHVACTKLLIKEKTIWKPEVGDAHFVGAAPATQFVTTLITLTKTSTVPHKKPFKTVSFVTTSTLTTTTTYMHTETASKELNFTVTKTSNSYAACQTSNFWGPIGKDWSHIINVYNQGMDSYSTYDIGSSKTAEDCCIECHTADLVESPCMGSVFVEQKCYLMIDKQAKCARGGSTSGGFFVARSGLEVDKWTREHRNMKFPEFVLSNGPCGFFYDNNLGW